MAAHAETLADDVEKQILEYMRLRSLQPGDTLPKEEELAEHLGVSRHIVREGLRGLKVLGLIEARKKYGMVMKHPSVFLGLKKLSEACLLQPQDRKELMELRISIELGMCSFIYQRRTPAEIRNLRKYVGVPSKYIQTMDQEIRFHTELVRLAKNQCVNQMREILALIFAPGYESLDFDWGNEAMKTSTHTDICDALESGTLEDFRKVMEIHFIPYCSAEKTFCSIKQNKEKIAETGKRKE